MSIEIEVRGLEEVRGRIQQADVDAMIEKTMEKAMAYVLGEVPAYPPPPENSTYRRTMTLGRKITTAVKPIGGEVVGVIGAYIEYGRDVVGEGEQRPVHEGRWWTLQGVVRGAAEGIEAIFKKAVEDLVKKANGG